jgi:hypothetical protein
MNADRVIEIHDGRIMSDSSASRELYEVAARR